MRYKHLKAFKGNHTFHYLPNIELYTVSFPSIKTYSVRFHLLIFRVGIEASVDFKTK